jgi:hypothetical protein
MISDVEKRRKAEAQIDRIRRIASGLESNCEVIFDGQPVPGTLRFRVETPAHVRLIESSGNIAIEDLESWTDEQLQERLVALSNHRLRASAES